MAQCAPCNISAPCQTQSARSKHSSARLGGIYLMDSERSSRIRDSSIGYHVCQLLVRLAIFLIFWPFFSILFLTVLYYQFRDLVIISDYRIGIILENFIRIIFYAYCVYAYLLLLFIYFFFEIKRNQRTRKFVFCEMKNEIKGNSCRLQKKKEKINKKIKLHILHSHQRVNLMRSSRTRINRTWIELLS